MLLLIAAGCMGDHSQCAEMKNAQRRPIVASGV
jgi:hypothetical protein